MTKEQKAEYDKKYRTENSEKIKQWALDRNLRIKNDPVLREQERLKDELRRRSKGIKPAKVASQTKEERREYNKIWSRENRDRFRTPEILERQHLRRVEKTYGLSKVDYYEMVKSQNNLCYLCNKPESRYNIDGSLKRLCVDHNHSTKKVRKLLCYKCNTVIGIIEKNNLNIDAFKRYLNDIT